MLILLMLLTSIHVYCVQHPLKLRTSCCRQPVKDLLSETDGMTWFEKLHNGHGSNGQLLFCEPYVEESPRYCAVSQRRIQYLSSTLEIEASFPFEKLLEHARMSEAFKELEVAWQALHSQQQVQHSPPWSKEGPCPSLNNPRDYL